MPPVSDPMSRVRDRNSSFKKASNVPHTRSSIQKSVFLETQEGTVEPDDVYIIPSKYKVEMLLSLLDDFGISERTIYNDPIGFIDHQRNIIEDYPIIDKDGGMSDIEKRKHATSLYCRMLSGRYGKRYDYHLNWALKNWVMGQTKNNEVAYGIQMTIRDKPTAAYPFKMIGNLYFEEDKVDLAIEAYTQALSIKPDYSDCYYCRGIAYCYNGDFRLAMCDYTKAIIYNGNHMYALYNRGVCFLRMGNFTDAKNDLVSSRDKGLDTAKIFREQYTDICTFENNENASIPKNIAAILTE